MLFDVKWAINFSSKHPFHVVSILLDGNNSQVENRMTLNSTMSTAVLDTLCDGLAGRPATLSIAA